jgi:PAS domain-containing protein
LVTHNRDVTEQRRLQLKLERTKQQLDAVASMADGFALFNADDRLVLCNERCRQLFPKSAALRVPGIPLRLLMREAAKLGEYAGVDESNAAGWITARLALLDAGQGQEVELAGGRWIEPLATRTADGGRIVVYREVTERKRLERELLAAKRRLDEALASMADALVLLGAHDRIVLCNERYRELFPKNADLLRQAAARRGSAAERRPRALRGQGARAGHVVGPPVPGAQTRGRSGRNRSCARLGGHRRRGGADPGARRLAHRAWSARASVPATARLGGWA